jgi:hypothetical protein
MHDARASTDGDSVELLVAEAIERGGDPATLEELCGRRPEHATALRARLARLEQLGLLGPLARAGGSDFGPRYRLLGRLGRGGMGIVYLAYDRETGRQVALKVSTAVAPRTAQRFQREIESHARLSHPGLVAVLDVGLVDGVPYFAMEYVDGETLAHKLERLRAAGVPPSERRADELVPGRTRGYVEAACHIACALARALEHVHAHGIVHRDVKPANVLIARDGRVLLLDLGLAHLADAEALTRTGDLAGTPAYMAPEQVAGSPSAIDARTDVYGLCAVLYEMLALRPPFAAPLGTPAARVLHAIQHAEPSPLSSLAPGLPRALETIIQHGLAKAPTERYANAEALARDLERFLAFEPIAARAPGAARRTLRWAKRRPAAALACALGGVLVLGAPLALWRHSSLVATERDRAKLSAREARDEAARNLEAAQFLEGLFLRFAASGDAAAAARALAALQQAMRDLEASALVSDTTRARLFEAVARVYRGLERTGAAVPLLDRAFALRQRALGEAHPETVASLQQLAAAHLALGDPESARSLLAHADAALADSAAGPLDALVRAVRVECEVTRGDLARSEQRPAEAHACYERALAWASLQASPAPALEAELCDRLGALEIAGGEVERGAERLARAVELRRLLPDARVLSLVASLRALAQARVDQHEPELAAQALDAALALLRKTEHAALLVEVADERLALPLNAPLDVLALREEAASQPAPDALAPPTGAEPGAFGRAFQRGVTALQAQRWAEAERAFDTALEASPRHPMCAYNAACALARAGESERAFAWLARAHEYGFGSLEQAERLLREDPDLALLRTNPRFDTLTHALLEAGHAARAFADEPALHVPSSAPQQRALLCVLHADGETKLAVLQGPWRAVADAQGCVLVAPSAPIATHADPALGMRWSLEAPDGHERRWLYERAVRAALVRVCARERIDPRRCYLAGVGRSGARAFDLALETTELFAGVLVVDALADEPVHAERARTAAGVGLRCALVADLGAPIDGLGAGLDPLRGLELAAQRWSSWGLDVALLSYRSADPAERPARWSEALRALGAPSSHDASK